MGMLLPEYGEFVVRPLFLTSAVADVYASYFAGVFALERSTQVGDEKAMFPFLTSYAPGWVKVQTRDKDADFTVTMGGRRLGGILKYMNLPWTCKPEVATRFPIAAMPASQAKESHLGLSAVSWSSAK